MFRFLTLVLALSAVAYGEVAETNELAGRIVGGTVAKIEDVPWQVSLLERLNHVCGATLISETWAISAAHCTVSRSAQFLALYAGIERHHVRGQVRGVDLVINHPNFQSVSADNDISLLRASAAFVLDSTIRPVALPAQGESVPAGSYGVVSGWGTTSEHSHTLASVLLQVWLPVVDQGVCNTSYLGRITENMLCAGYMTGGRDACGGDSGGPFVVNGQLVGVVSWGTGCGRPNFPGVYARVSHYRDWIRTNTGV